MKNIKGNKFLTIAGVAGEVYKITYTKCFEVDIINSSEGDLYVGDSEGFTTEDDVSDYAVIKSGSYYNGLRVSGALYLKTNGAGEITVIRFS